MFDGATRQFQDRMWDVSFVASIDYTFYGATNFTTRIQGVSSVVWISCFMRYMFQECSPVYAATVQERRSSAFHKYYYYLFLFSCCA